MVTDDGDGRAPDFVENHLRGIRWESGGCLARDIRDAAAGYEGRQCTGEDEVGDHGNAEVSTMARFGGGRREENPPTHGRGTTWDRGGTACPFS